MWEKVRVRLHGPAGISSARSIPAGKIAPKGGMRVPVIIKDWVPETRALMSSEKESIMTHFTVPAWLVSRGAGPVGLEGCVIATIGG